MMKALLILAASTAWTPLRAQSVSFPVSQAQTFGLRLPGLRSPLVDISLPSIVLPIQPVFYQAAVLPQLRFPQPQKPVFPSPLEKPHWPAAPVKLEPAAPAPAQPSKGGRKSKPALAENQDKAVSFKVLESSWEDTFSAPEGGKALASRLQAAFDGSSPEEVEAAPEPVDARPPAPTQNLPEWELERDLGVR